MLSVLILTRNEEQELPTCLAALDWCDDLIVYDSYSTDRTESIALDAGARFVRRPGQDLSIAFGGDEAFHRTWGLREIPFFHPWVFVLDADERLSTEAYQEILHLFSNLDSKNLDSSNSAPVAYQLRRRDFFRGRHLKHVQVTPWYIRLFRPEFVHYERLINPVTVVNGPIASIHGFIDHFPFSKGMNDWIDRHNTYSTLEARQLSTAPSLVTPLVLRSALFAPHFSQRRFYQKLVFNNLPARPVLKFFWTYILKRGFLDGRSGLSYALLQAIYEFFIQLKLDELKHPR